MIIGKIKSSVIIFSIIYFIVLVGVAHADDSVETTGDVLQIVLPSVAYAMTFGYKDAEGRNRFYKSFLTTLSITYGLKLSVDKKRPNGGDMSFPSGHTSAAFSGASFIQRRYGWKFGLPAYLAASYVGWSRVESDNHFTEDVLAGALIGTASTYFFTKPYNPKINASFYYSRKFRGLAITGRW